MFVKITRSGPRRYVQLVEAFRDRDGLPKQRTVATLGRLDQMDTQLESVIAGLSRLTGHTLPKPAVPQIAFESARALGDVWALTQLWNTLGFDQLRRTFGSTRHRIDIEALLRIMVFNRLCDPDSKLGVLRWLETVSLPGLSVQTVEHQHLLRAMDALVDQREAVEKVVAGLLRPLLDQDLAVVFYDMTTIRAEGLSQQPGDVRQFGMAKEGLVARQFMLGIVQTSEGIPLYHEVFEGNTAEVTTLKATIEKVIARFPIKRVIAVADRGLLSIDSLADLQSITLPSGRPLEFILAVPGRRYSELAPLLENWHRTHCLSAAEEVVGEVAWQQLRLIAAHNPQTAAQMGQRRDTTIAELEQQAEQCTAKLQAQDAGQRARGRKLSDGGTTARFYHAVCEAHLSRIIRVDLKGKWFNYAIDEQALQHARMMDGKLLLVTNAADLRPAEVVERYKSLADIERGFRVLKSEIEIGPVYHRLPDRIRAHATICFIALILHRVMRQRLRDAKSDLSPERTLTLLRRIQHHRVTLDHTTPVSGVSCINSDQAAALSALGAKKPTANEQLTLL